VKHILIGLSLGLSLVACGGTAPFGLDEADADTATGSSAYLTEDGEFLTLNNISYDPDSDTLQLNNIPFDDPENNYQRITTEAFNNNFDAYDSAPAAGSNEIQYFAVFRRSDSGESQVAAAGTNGYIQFGYGGAGAQRLGNKPTLPSTGIYSYTGEYAGVRTTRVGDATDGVQLVTGTARLQADFGDFDETGAVGGTIRNRTLYTTAGVPVGTLDGFISLADGTIDFENAVIQGTNAVEVAADGTQTSGNWSGVFAGPGGSEIAGALFVEGDEFREVGGVVVNCTTAACNP